MEWEQILFEDTVHGIKAIAFNKASAWMLIRNECYERGLRVPSLDKIKQVVIANKTQ
jgi:hypothetical protein